MKVQGNMYINNPEVVKIMFRRKKRFLKIFFLKMM